MIKFDNLTNTNPKNGDYHSKTKTTTILTNSMGRLYCPYDGVVMVNYSNKCSGYILIKHLINNKVYFSEFCNTPRIIVGKSDYVKKGQTIGHFLNDTDNVSYTLYDSNRNKINPEPFFRGFKPLSNTDKTSKEKVKEKKKVKGDDKHTTGKDYNLFLSLALSPLDFVSKQAGKVVKKAKDEIKQSGKDMFKLKDDDDNKSINESINRIKKLL